MFGGVIVGDPKTGQDPGQGDESGQPHGDGRNRIDTVEDQGSANDRGHRWNEAVTASRHFVFFDIRTVRDVVATMRRAMKDAPAIMRRHSAAALAPRMAPATRFATMVETQKATTRV